MLKKIAALFLLLCVMAQQFSQAAIIGSYYVNTASYAKDCINKARPKLHCNGKCQMMKKLKQEEKKDAQNPENKGSGKSQVLSSKSYFASLQMVSPCIVKPLSAREPSFTIDISSEIFHPPGA